MNPDRRCPAPRTTVEQPPPHFTCPRCAATSYHPDDVRYGYCGRCHDFTELMGKWLWGVVERITDDTIRAACYACGWWSAPMPTHESAAEMMLAHLRSTAHQP